MKLSPVPAFQDNYLWLLQDRAGALVVDPGDAAAVLAALHQTGARLEAILVTHHHADHTGGVQALHEATGARVYGPALESIPGPCEPVTGGQQVQALGLSFEVIDVPGHTAGHIAYYCEAPGGGQPPLLFCGDTLFSGGCGRLFEGSPAQMLDSLDRLAQLPAETRVCCAHEYTLGNLRFARAVEPENAELAQYQSHCEALRARELPTLPSTVGLERAVNPFLRSRMPAVAEAARAVRGANPQDPVAVFAALRLWKNEFR
jgi:hydroxyacylglutathione hydrolase